MKQEEAEKLNQLNQKVDDLSDQLREKKDKDSLGKDLAQNSITASSVGALAPLLVSNKAPDAIQKPLEEGKIPGLKDFKGLATEARNQPLANNLAVQGAGGRVGLALGAGGTLGAALISDNSKE